MILVFVLLLAGVLLARVPGLPARAPEVLDVVVIWIALPALILREIPKLTFDARMVVPLAVAWGSLLLSAGLVWVAGKALGWSRKTLGTLLVVVPLGNTSFLGLAAVTGLLGADHLGPALVYDQLGSFVGLATWATLIAAVFGTDDRPSLAEIGLRIVRFPPFVALCVAVLLRFVPPTALPAGVWSGLDEVLAPLAGMLVPLAMLTVGMRLKAPSAAGVWTPVGVGLAIRMVVAPAAALVVLWGFGPLDVVGRASVLECAMPPMVTAGVLATNAGLDEDVAAGLVGAGVLFALGTLPVWSTVLLG